MSLSTRLMVVLLAPVAILFAAQGAVNVRLRRHAMMTEAAREVRDHGIALSIAMETLLRDRHLADLSQLSEDLSHAERIRGVMIFDRNNRLVACSSSVSTLRDEFAAAAEAVRRLNRAREEVRTIGSTRLLAYTFPLGHGGDIPVRGAAVLLRDLQYTDERSLAYAQQLALVGAVVLAIIAAGIWLAMRSAVLIPVSTLVQGFEKVTAGALDARIAIGRRDEMGRMAIAFNHMTESLQNARHALEATNAANVALERRVQHAQRLALIGQLAANVAHQIGSPLNVVLGRARYALKHGGQSERDARHFHEIVSGAEKISGFIEQLLSQARRGRGKLERVDLGKLVQETMRFLESECDRAGIVASIASEANVIVSIMRSEIEQVVLNLCVNAIQAQPKGGRLDIQVLCTQDVEKGATAQVIVKDAGPGIPPEIRENIFEAFYTTKPPNEGTGLGLAICDEIVRLHAGTIVVRHPSSGGAEFCVSLPVASAESSTSATGAATL